MSSFRRSVAGSLTLGVGLILLSNLAHAQIWSQIMAEKNLTAQEVAPEKVPEFGTFWSFARTNYPPLPFNQFPDLPVYYLGYGNAFLVDDSSVDFVDLAEARETDKALRKLELENGLRVADELDAWEEAESGMMQMAYEYPTNNALWLEITSVTNGFANLMVHGTVADEVYEILSQESLTNGPWASEGTILGAAGQDWTATLVPVGQRTNSLFLWARSWQDSDGDGLPDWYELEVTGTDPNNPDTGNTGVSDGYKDSDGDGWTNLEEYQHGTNPNVFNTPHAPQPIHARVEAHGSNVLISWGPAGGNVVEYVLLRRNIWSWEYEEIARLPATNRTYVDVGIAATNQVGDLYYGMYAEYANDEDTETEFFSAATDDQQLPVFLMFGPGRQPYAVLTQVPTGLQQLHFEMGMYYSWGLFTNIFAFDLFPTNFQNGIATLPTNLFGATGSWSGQVVGYYDTDGRSAETGVSISPEGQAYVDAAKYLKANLNFLLRAATITHSFAIADTYGQFDIHRPSSTNYEYYPIQNPYGGKHPDTDNYTWLNFLWASTNVGPGYIFDTGAYCDRLSSPAPADGVALGGIARYSWYAPLINLPVAPPVGLTNNPNWVFFDDLSLGTNRANSVGLSIGANGFVSLAANARNIYGLPITSALFFCTNGSVATVNAGGNATLGPLAASFFQTEQPQLQTVDYYFARGYVTLEYDFQTTNTSPFMAMSVGEFSLFTGFAKQTILNGYNDKFAYLGQYFDKALKVATNGSVTTNATGILSEYGEFYATEAGRVALVTKPDIQTGQRGTAVVHVVKIQFDVNHDGVMDLSSTGSDNTSVEKPFQFWANNDIDRWHWVDGSDSEQDDLEKVDSSIHFSQAYPGPDYAFLTYPGVPAIPCPRDLEDYTRLWIPGLTSLLAAMPTNYTAELVYSGDAPLRVFRAYEADGGTNYLFDEATASNQVANSASLYLGLVGSSFTSPIILNGQTNIGDHFIFCGTQPSSGSLSLQIYDENLSPVCLTWAYLQINDIKEMYERWTVGDVASRGPYDYAYPATENLPVGTTSFQYGPRENTNTPYILFVHGWNMKPWEKDRFAETAFKRLYWQGYQGRFGSFRWPTDNGFTGLWDAATDRRNYDNSEFNAWKSAPMLTGFVKTNLNAQYPGRVYLMAHSMGNVVAGEALRLSTNQIVNTYVASQAAVPAHTYDGTIAPYSFTYLALSYGPRAPNIYSNWFTLNSSGAGQRVNFYNVNDYALQRPRWELNQLLKPDQATTLGWTYLFDGFPYDNIQSYTNTPDDTPPWNHFQKEKGLSRIYFSIVSSLPDRYEVMSYAAQSRSTALGRTASVGNLERNIDLARSTPTRIWPPDTQDQAPDQYSRHKWHSAEFRSTNMRQKGYWQTLLSEEGFNITP